MLFAQAREHLDPAQLETLKALLADGARVQKIIHSGGHAPQTPIRAQK